MIKVRVADNTKVIEKRNFDRSSRNEYSKGIKKTFSKSIPNNKSGDNKEARWWEKCKVKHVGQCNKVVTCYTYGKLVTMLPNVLLLKRHVLNVRKTSISKMIAHG